VTRIGDWGEYLARATRNADDKRRRLAVERALASAEPRFKVPGWCYVCGESRSFEVDWSYSYPVDGVPSPNWREHLRCPVCGLNNRMRATIQVLEQECGLPPDAQIYVTEQVTPLYAALRSRFGNLIGSEWLQTEVGRGASNPDGIRNEDVRRLSFASERFDAIVCLDVLEHVPAYLLAFADLRRCLRRGGALLFSVPFIDQAEITRRAEVLADGSIRHLEAPEYHGDPLNPDGCLCFYHFGWALLDELRALGFSEVCSLRYWSRELGYLGEGEQRIFLARRPSEGP